MPTLKKSLISLDTLGGQWRVVELPHGPGGRQGATGALHQRCGHRALSTRQGMLQGWEANRVSGFGRIVFTIGFKHDGFERNRVTILTHHSNPCPSGCSLCSRPRSSYSDWRRNIRILQRPGSLWTLGTALVDHHGWIVPRGKGGKSPIVAPSVKGLNQKDQFQRGTIQVPTPLDCMMKGSALTPTFSIGGDSNASFGVFCFQLCTPLLVFSIEAYWSILKLQVHFNPSRGDAARVCRGRLAHVPGPVQGVQGPFIPYIPWQERPKKRQRSISQIDWKLKKFEISGNCLDFTNPSISWIGFLMFLVICGAFPNIAHHGAPDQVVPGQPRSDQGQGWEAVAGNHHVIIMFGQIPAMLLEVVALQAILWQEEVDNFLKKWNEAVVLCMLITHCNAIYDSFEWGLAVYYVIGIQSHQTTSKAMKYSLIPVAINIY